MFSNAKRQFCTRKTHKSRSGQSSCFSSGFPHCVNLWSLFNRRPLFIIRICVCSPGSSLKITLLPTSIHFQLLSWRSFRSVLNHGNEPRRFRYFITMSVRLRLVAFESDALFALTCRFWRVKTGTRWCITGSALREAYSMACGPPSTSLCSRWLVIVSFRNVWKWNQVQFVQLCLKQQLQNNRKALILM